VLLVGLGFGELSMAPTAIPRVKAALRAVPAATARSLATRCLELPTGEEVLRLVSRELPLEAVAAGEGGGRP
jgi:phosphoenolpyruvate-protein kinase (PTS system EI component)